MQELIYIHSNLFSFISQYILLCRKVLYSASSCFHIRNLIRRSVIMLMLLVHVGWTSGIFMFYILLELRSHLNWKDVFHTNLEVKVTLVIHTWMPERSSHTVLHQTRHKRTLWEATSLHQGQVFSLALYKCQTLPVPFRGTEVVYSLWGVLL